MPTGVLGTSPEVAEHVQEHQEKPRRDPRFAGLNITPMWSRKPNISFGLLVIHIAFQRQYCECEFWEPAKNSQSCRSPSLWQGSLQSGCPESPSLWGTPVVELPKETWSQVSTSLSVRAAQCGGQDEKGSSSSCSLEGDQGKEGKLGISAFQCICNVLSSGIILFPQTHSRKCFWRGRMCQCLASQGYMAKVTLPRHHLRDMTENPVKNRLTCHYSKSSFIWEWILVLGHDSTAAGFFHVCA